MQDIKSTTIQSRSFDEKKHLQTHDEAQSTP
jgi:hypothetical protein